MKKQYEKKEASKLLKENRPVERKLNKKKFIQYEAKELDDGIANIYLLKNCTPPNLKEH